MVLKVDCCENVIRKVLLRMFFFVLGLSLCVV